MSWGQGLQVLPRGGSAADPDEQVLLRASQDGDVEAFARVYERYRQALYTLCLGRLRDAGRAEDVVQDTFLRAFTNLGKFDLGRPVWPWLATMARHVCVDVQRLGARVSLVQEVDGGDVGVGAWRRGSADITLDAVIQEERREHLELALTHLPHRQKRALLLYALEGWSYPDIASAEGTSLTSVKSLIWRARMTLRRVCEAGAFGVVVVPWRALRRRLRGLETRVRATSAPQADGLAMGAQAIAYLVAVAMVTASSGFPSGPGIGGLGDGGGSLASAPVTSAGPAPGSPPPTHHPGSAPPLDRAFSADETTRSLYNEAFNPTGEATPDNSRFHSIVSSPNYARDHTIYAAGSVGCQRDRTCPVLFASRDGGATWTKLAAEDFRGRVLILPPSHPRNRSIFAMGPSGLQESTDGGASFDGVNPLVGGVAISPRFDVDDPRILIGTTAVIEYWADRQLMKPAPLALVSGPVSNPVFSPAYPGQEVILVGVQRRAPTGEQLESVVYRCQGSICDGAELAAGGETPSVRLSPGFERDGIAYAFTDTTLFVSGDGARSFRPIALPGGERLLTDLVVSVETGRLTLTASFRALTGRSSVGVARSLDGGRSWAQRPVGLLGFRRGVTRVHVLPTGRLVAVSAESGIACSDDGGLHWSRRCRPEVGQS